MVEINKEKCIGCAMCESICPEVFEMNDKGKAQVKEQKDIPCVKQAIDNCPVQAISK